MTQTQLDSDIEVKVQQLNKTAGSDFNGEVLGYGTMYAVGADFNCIVPRKWLINQISDLDLPDSIIPKKVSRVYAYNRAVDRLKEDWDREYSFRFPHAQTNEPMNHKAEVDIHDGDGTRLHHIQLRVFFEADEVKEEGGKWVTHDIGFIDFNYDDQAIVTRMNPEKQGLEAHETVWNDVVDRLTKWTDQMEHHHLARDIRNMMYDVITNRTNTVIPLQRGVYLFPAGLGSFVDKMAELYRRIDAHYKTKGEPVAIRTFEILNTDEKRNWIEHRVRSEVESNIGKVLDEAFKKFDDEATTDEVTQIIRQNLSGHTDTADVYNSLLQAEISVNEVLEAQKERVREEEKQSIIDSVIRQTELGEY